MPKNDTDHSGLPPVSTINQVNAPQTCLQANLMAATPK